MNDIRFGEQLLLLRRRNKLTQQEVADFLGWDRQKYSRIERSEDIGQVLRYTEYLEFNEKLLNLFKS